MLAHDAIRSNNWTSNSQIAEALESSHPDLAQWVRLHQSADSVFGVTPGVALYLADRQVDMRAVDALLAAQRDPALAWYWDGLRAILRAAQAATATVTAAVAERLEYVQVADRIGDAFPGQPRVARFLDSHYWTVASTELRRLIDAVGYQYGQWIEESQDCDEWAGRLWGALQRVQPGNLPIGFAVINGQSVTGQEQGHALLLAVCSDGAYWIENTGLLHRVGDLPGWRNSAVELGVCVL